MKQETLTKEKLLRAAKDEFMEKGYLSASLRNICKKAEVTTGALYFFFRDKEDLFGSLVDEPLNKLYEITKLHYDDEMREMESEFYLEHGIEDDRQSAILAVDYMFDHHDAFVLLLKKASGSKYENCFDQFVEFTETHYRNLIKAASQYYHAARFDEQTIHWMSHIQIYSFAYLITHNLTKEEALKQIDTIVIYLTSGLFVLNKSI
jgi:AcrR family transcriptional regulator